MELFKEVHVLEKEGNKLKWNVKLRTKSIEEANKVLEFQKKLKTTIRAEIETVTESGEIYRHYLARMTRC